MCWNLSRRSALVPPINADSNIESAVDASLQSTLDKDVSGVGCADFFHNTTVGGNLANKKATRDHYDLNIWLRPRRLLISNQVAFFI